MLNVLIVTHQHYHPGAPCAEIMRRLLERQRYAACRIAELEDALTGSLDRTDVIVLFCVTRELSAQAERNLCAFVKRGGGLVALHAAMDCKPKHRRFLDLLGAEFVDHDPNVPQWEVLFTDQDHPLAQGMSDFRITDEFYQIRVRDPQAKPFVAFIRHGKAMPLALTRNEGRGRVFTLALGHGPEAYRNPGFQRLLLRGVAFAAGREVAKPFEMGVGILGFRPGGMGGHHVKLMRHAGGFRPVAACDTADFARANAQEEFGLQTYTLHQKMLENDEVQMVVVILPHHLHTREALRAIESGRHVVVEKPFALTMKETDKLMDAATKHGVNVTCFQNRRWDHHYQAARRLLDDYENIGDVVEVRLDLGAYGGMSSGWRSDKKISGGLLYDMGAHAVDWILNWIDKPVVGVAGYTLHRQWHMVTNETHGRVVLRFADGEIATYCDSRLHAGKQPEALKILGTEGAICFPHVFDEVMQWTQVRDGRQRHSEVACPGDPWAWGEFYRHLADHFCFGLPQGVTPQSAARVVGVLETAYRSARAGREMAFKDKYFDSRL